MVILLALAQISLDGKSVDSVEEFCSDVDVGLKYMIYACAQQGVFVTFSSL